MQCAPSGPKVHPLITHTLLVQHEQLGLVLGVLRRHSSRDELRYLAQLDFNASLCRGISKQRRSKLIGRLHQLPVRGDLVVEGAEDFGDGTLLAQRRHRHFEFRNIVPIEHRLHTARVKSAQIHRLEQVKYEARAVSMKVSRIQGCVQWPKVAFRPSRNAQIGCSADNESRTFDRALVMPSGGHSSRQHRERPFAPAVSRQIEPTPKLDDLVERLRPPQFRKHRHSTLPNCSRTTFWSRSDSSNCA
ncbi:hypothetical protein RHCRD62_30362 [Rhodococcus sp. RD6.2]|nr:hypothetical protein RHCRD62_30362 [Rhodococcus sp. RD6.2]